MGPGIIRPLRLGAARALAASAMVAALCPGAASAQSVESARTVATVMTPASMAKTADMNFGRIAPKGSPGGTVVLNPAGSGSCTSSANLIRTGTCQPATFVVYGRHNWLVRIRELNNGVITLLGPNGATMLVNTLTISVDNLTPVSGGGSPAGNLGRYRIIDPSGMATFRIGGTLTVGTNQEPGVYTGVLNVQVNYN